MADPDASTAAAAPDLLLKRLDQNVTKQPNKQLLSFLSPGPNGGKLQQQLTYADVGRETSHLAQRLLEAGLSKGDRAVLVYPPSLEYMVAFLACLKIGVIAVPVFPPNPAKRDTLHMFGKICESSGAKYALTSNDYNHLKKIAGIRDAVTKFKRPIASWPEYLEWISTDDKNKKPKGEFQENGYQDFKTSDLAFLQYTSGSTSEPKGVMITHGNLAHNLSIITNELKAAEDTIVVSWLPQYHDMGLIGSFLGVIYSGGSGFYLSPLSFLQRPMLWMEAVSKYQATHLQAPNFAFKLTSRKFNAASYDNNSLNLSSVRHIINAAEPVDEESMQAFESSFGPFGLGKVMFPTYGLAEHTVFVCSGGKQRLGVLKRELEAEGKVVLAKTDPSPTDGSVSRLVGCGFPARQGIDVRIVDRETCQELDADTVGEIWIQSPSKAAGYFQMELASKEDFHAQLKGSPNSDTDDSYLRTGDLGFLHNDELFICGRLKDLIIVGGRNYYPQDLEATTEATSNLLRPGCCAAFTVDPTKGGDEEVAVIVELRDVPTANDIENVCLPLADQVFKAINQEHSLGIGHIVFLRTKTVPKTTSGKIARAWCRKGYLAGSLQIVYKKSFKTSMANFEIEQSSTNPQVSPGIISPEQLEELRAMDRQAILKKLTADVANVTSMTSDLIDKEASLVSILDSMSISQFSGLLESSYGVKISDHYLFNESTTLVKLVDVVKLGYAPDDEGGEGGNGAPSNDAFQQEGKAKGLAGVLGCPPGVVLCAIM